MRPKKRIEEKKVMVGFKVMPQTKAGLQRIVDSGWNLSRLLEEQAIELINKLEKEGKLQNEQRY